MKNFCEDFFFFGEHLRLCPWSLALASSIPALGLESVCPRKGCPWPRIFFVSLALASSLVSSTPPLVIILPCAYPVAYAGFSKGEGGRKFRKVEINEGQNENFPAQNQFRFPAQT